MSFIAVATIGTGLVGSALSSKAAGDAADDASAAQTASAQAGIDEQRRQFDSVQALLAPYVGAGTGALQSQLDLMGIGGTQAVQAQDAYTIPGTPATGATAADLTTGQFFGLLDGSFDPSSLGQAGTAATPDQYIPAVAGVAGVSAADAQQNAINSLIAGPEFQSLVAQGEAGILGNASATGGLRGGNTQGALAQFRPQMLTALINQQLGRYSGVAASGQNAASQQAAAGQNTANSISALLEQQGASQAGAALAQGQAQSNLYGDFATGIGAGLSTIGDSLGSGTSLELF